MTQAILRDISGAVASPTLDLWEPVVITGEQISAEAERLASLDRPANGRRETMILHPRAAALGNGLVPGIRVVLSVLKPGEETAPIRHNSTQVNFCIRGSGCAHIGGMVVRYEKYDVWNTPSFRAYTHRNDGNDLQIRLTYSNAPLLEFLNTHIVEEGPALTAEPQHSKDDEEVRNDPRRKSSFWHRHAGERFAADAVRDSDQSAHGRINTLHWPWTQVKTHLDKLEALGKDYIGRRLVHDVQSYDRTHERRVHLHSSLRSPIRPPRIVDRPHRHTSAAINYYFHGRGRSTVEGKVYEWKAGDLMLSAPGWGVHNHASYDEPVYELTVQDQPLNIYMESLLWQEDLKHPAALLGSEAGFDTNRVRMAAAE